MPKQRQHRSPRPVPPKRIAWEPSANPALTEAILAVVDQQMCDNTPPETRRTFERLVAQGYTPEDARRLIGNIVAQEIFAVMQREEAYHEQRYITALRGLQTARSRSVCGPRGAACRVRREDHAPCAATMAQRL